VSDTQTDGGFLALYQELLFFPKRSFMLVTIEEMELETLYFNLKIK
jgi:hypothetical protein